MALRLARQILLGVEFVNQLRSRFLVEGFAWTRRSRFERERRERVSRAQSVLLSAEVVIVEGVRPLHHALPEQRGAVGRSLERLCPSSVSTVEAAVCERFDDRHHGPARDILHVAARLLAHTAMLHENRGRAEKAVTISRDSGLRPAIVEGEVCMRGFVYGVEGRRYDLFRQIDDIRVNARSGGPEGRASDQVAVRIERRPLPVKVDHHRDVIGSASRVVKGTDIERFGDGVFVVGEWRVRVVKRVIGKVGMVAVNVITLIAPIEGGAWTGRADGRVGVVAPRLAAGRCVEAVYVHARDDNDGKLLPDELRLLGVRREIADQSDRAVSRHVLVAVLLGDDDHFDRPAADDNVGYEAAASLYRIRRLVELSSALARLRDVLECGDQSVIVADG